jgi:hypothetical protein
VRLIVEEQTKPARTPPGLLVIIATFALGALASIYVLSLGTPTGQTFGSICAPICFLIAFGLWSRGELTRKAVVGLLALSLAGEAVLFLTNVAGLIGVVSLPANAKPLKAISTAVFRVWFTYWMFSYLRKDDIRALFAKRKRQQETAHEVNEEPGEEPQKSEVDN